MCNFTIIKHSHSSIYSLKKKILNFFTKSVFNPILMLQMIRFHQQTICKSTPTSVFRQWVSAKHTELSNHKSVIYICISLESPLILIDQSAVRFSQSINSPRPVFLTERKPRWAKPAHPDNRDKLGSERMNWSDLCSSQADYQPLYIFEHRHLYVSHLYQDYIEYSFPGHAASAQAYTFWASIFS